jgi:hypothetical protein
LKAACSRRSFVISSSWVGTRAAVAAGVADCAADVGRYATGRTWVGADVQLVGVRPDATLKVELSVKG